MSKILVLESPVTSHAALVNGLIKLYTTFR